MAEDIEKSSDGTKIPEAAQPKTKIKSDLPNVESPPLSPAGEEPSVVLGPKVEGEAKPYPAAARFHLKPRQKRQAGMAASVLLAGAIGAIIGARATAPAMPPPGTVALPEREAMQQSIARINREIATLKSEIDVGTKSVRSQITKISERLDHPPAPETTGSIPIQPTAVPRPSPRPDIRTTVMHDWRIYNVHDGVVAVQGHGDIYEIGIGAPLPGLGPVQQIKRQDGRWVVVTPKGLIVSLPDRQYFEQ